MTYQPAFDLDHDTKPFMMMWFDNDPKVTLQDKILRAAAYYHQKYNRTPTICKVPVTCQIPTDWKVLAVNGILIVLDNTVLTNHFYIGLEEQGE